MGKNIIFMERRGNGKHMNMQMAVLLVDGCTYFTQMGRPCVILYYTIDKILEAGRGGEAVRHIRKPPASLALGRRIERLLEIEEKFSDRTMTFMEISFLKSKRSHHSDISFVVKNRASIQGYR